MSDPNSKADSDSEKSKGRPWTRWRCFRWTCRILALLVIGIAVAGFFARGWLTERAMEYVEERLHRQGVYFKHGPVVYEVDRGLVIEDVVLFETEEKTRPYLKLSNIGLDFGLANLLLGEELDIRSVEVSINRGVLKLYDGELVAEVRRLQFFGRSSPQWIEVQSAEGLLNGMEFRATGNHRDQKRDRGSEGKGESEDQERPKRKKPEFGRLRNLGKLIDFESDRKPPVLKLNVESDKRDGAEEPFRIVATLSGSNLRWKGLPLEELGAEFVVTESDRMIDISKATARYRGRGLEGKMRYDLDAKVVELENLVTDFDLIALLGEPPIGLGEKVDMVQMPEPPRLFFSGRVPVEDLFSSAILMNFERAGDLLIGKSERPLAIRLLNGGVRYQSGAVNSEALKIGLFDGLATIAGAINLVEKPTAYEGGVSVSGMPLKTVLEHFGKEGEWPGTISGSFAGMGGLTLDSIEGTGDLTLDAEELSLKGPFSLNQAVVATDGLNVAYGGGVAAVAGRLDTAATPMTFETAVNMDSMPVQSLLDLAGIEKTVAGNLTAQFRASGENTIASIEGSGDLTLESEEISVKGPISLNQAVVATEGLNVAYGGGAAAVAGRLDTAASPMTFETAVNMESMPVQSLLDLAGIEKKVAGNLTAQIRASGENTVESIVGSGEVNFVSEEYEVVGPISLAKKVVSTEGLAAKYGGGVAVAKGKLNTAVSPPVYEGALNLESMPIQSLLTLAKVEKKMAGILSGRFEGSGSQSVESIAGAGEIEFVDDAHRVEGPYNFNAGVVESEGLNVELGGGRIGVRGKADLLASPKTFEGNLQAEAVSIQSLLDLAGADKEVDGKLFAQFDGSGSENLASLNGNGAIRIEDGKLYSVPLFGQLRTFLAGVVPTFGKVQQSDLEATFTLREGVLHSEDLVAASDMTRVEVAGDLNLGEKTADFTALAKVEGVVGVATNVVSRLLELEADGPIDDLDIRLKNNAAGMAAGAVKETVDMAKDGVSGLKDGAKNVGGTAVRAGTEGVKKVGKGIGKLIPGLKKKEEPGTEMPAKQPPPAELAPVETAPSGESSPTPVPIPRAEPVPQS